MYLTRSIAADWPSGQRFLGQMEGVWDRSKRRGDVAHQSIHVSNTDQFRFSTPSDASEVSRLKDRRLKVMV